MWQRVVRSMAHVLPESHRQVAVQCRLTMTVSVLLELVTMVRFAGRWRPLDHCALHLLGQRCLAMPMFQSVAHGKQLHDLLRERHPFRRASHLARRIRQHWWANVVQQLMVQGMISLLAKLMLALE